jgi:hypothetical protein
MRKVILNIIVFLVAGHFADSLIMSNWTVLSVRRIMTLIGLVGPAIFMLIFMTVDNLVLAIW